MGDEREEAGRVEPPGWDVDEDVERAWQVEISRRAAELDAGTVRTLSWEEVEEALRLRFGE